MSRCFGALLKASTVHSPRPQHWKNGIRLFRHLALSIFRMNRLQSKVSRACGQQQCFTMWSSQAQISFHSVAGFCYLWAGFELDRVSTASIPSAWKPGAVSESCTDERNTSKFERRGITDEPVNMAESVELKKYSFFPRLNELLAWHFPLDQLC